MMKRTKALIKSNDLREAMSIPSDYQLVPQQGMKHHFPIQFRKNNETIEVFGKVEEYKGKEEIIAQKIRVIR